MAKLSCCKVWQRKDEDLRKESWKPRQRFIGKGLELQRIDCYSPDFSFAQPLHRHACGTSFSSLMRQSMILLIPGGPSVFERIETRLDVHPAKTQVSLGEPWKKAA